MLLHPPLSFDMLVLAAGVYRSSDYVFVMAVRRRDYRLSLGSLLQTVLQSNN